MGLLSFLTGTSRAPAHHPAKIGSREFKADPFPFYARLRAEAPVYRMKLPTGETVWLITRYEDVAMVLSDERFIKNRSNALTREQDANQVWVRKLLKLKWFNPLQQTMLHLDPPDHTRLRALVTRAFTPRLIEQVREDVGSDSRPKHFSGPAKTGVEAGPPMRAVHVYREPDRDGSRSRLDCDCRSFNAEPFD